MSIGFWVMGEGWLKLYRKIAEWEWYTKSEMVHLFLHLIIKATPHEKTWRGIKLSRGQIIASRQKLSVETGISEMKIRTCLQRLQDSGEITITSSNRFSVITVCNYDNYQVVSSNDNQQTNQPNNQQDNQPTNHNIRNKEYNNIPSSTPTDVGAEEVPRQNKFKRKNPEEYTIVTKGRIVFEAYFKKIYETEYVWSKTDAAMMKTLLGKLTSSRKARGMTLDDDSVVSALSVFLDSIDDTWILEHMSLDVIVKSYNRIVAHARAAKNVRNETGETGSAQTQAGADVLTRQRATVVDDIAKADELYYNGK